jgi:ABC-type glycerol-3-phosphate transport system substrate-binding protein
MGEMKSKKMIAVLLSVLLLLSVIAGGCADKAVSPDRSGQINASDAPDVSAAPGDPSQASDYDSKAQSGQKEEEASQVDDIAFKETPMDLGGREIKFLTPVPQNWTLNETVENTDHYVVETVEALKSIEKDYNCKITVVEQKGKPLVEDAVTAKAAGDVLGDILEMDIAGSYMEKLYGQETIMPLEDSEIIGIGQNPWLSSSDFAYMLGHHYGVSFIPKTSGDIIRGCIVFNKTLYDEIGLENPYDLVRNHRWTYDEFKQICEKIVEKYGDKVYPIGYLKESMFTPTVVVGNNGAFVDSTPEGWKYDPFKDATMEGLNFIVDLLKAGYVYPHPDDKAFDEDQLFMDRKLVFYFTTYSAMRRFKKEMPDEYGLLPAPIGKGGTKYGAVLYNDFIYHIFEGIDKPEEVCAVLVAIANRCSRDYKNLIEDELLYALPNMESAEMLQSMYRDAIIDISRSVSDVRVAIKGASTRILSLEQTPVEALKEIEAKCQTALDQTKINMDQQKID